MIKVPTFQHCSTGTLDGTPGDMYVLCNMLTDEQRADYEKQGCTVGTAHPVFGRGAMNQYTDTHQTFQTLFIPDGIDYDF